MATIGKGERKGVHAGQLQMRCKRVESETTPATCVTSAEERSKKLYSLSFLFLFGTLKSYRRSLEQGKHTLRRGLVFCKSSVCVCAIHKTKIQTDLQLRHYCPALCSHLLIFKLSSDQPKGFMCNPSAINPVWVTPTDLLSMSPQSRVAFELCHCH